MISTEYLDRLRSHLSHIEARIAADVRPQPDGGALVLASTPLADVAPAQITAAVITAHRAVATTGAVPRAVILHGAGELPQHALEQLRLIGEVDAAASTLSLTVSGEVDDVDRCTPMPLQFDGDLVYWLGFSEAPDVERLPTERKVAEVMVGASRDGLLNAALDVGAGGMATTIALMAMVGGRGARFWTPERFDVERALFDVALGGVICIVPRTEELRFSDMCIARHLPLERVGVVDGTDLECQGHFIVPTADLA